VVRMEAAAQSSPSSRAGLPARAWTYLAGVYVAGGIAVLLAFPVSVDRETVELALVLGALAAVGQLFVVITPRNQSYHVTPGLIVAGAILLPVPLVAAIVVAQHVPEWVKERYPWFIQIFNIANYTLGAVAASAVYGAIADRAPGGADTRFVLGGLAATVAFVLVTHVLLALVLCLARGHSFLETGLFTFHSLSVDGVLTVLGVVIAALWSDNPLLIVPALAPLLLLHRTLLLPKLEAEARQDPKTGLYNARFFTDALEEAIERLERGGAPFSLLLADLDLLREINNRFGHLAGDIVLAGVARVFRDTLRPHDIAARFGGEEFCVLLPDTPEADALGIAERIRRAVESASFEVDTATAPISVTVSIGLASAPTDAATARDLLHLADVAVYRAKGEGRNRTTWASKPPGPIDAAASAGQAAAALPEQTDEYRSQVAAPEPTADVSGLRSGERSRASSSPAPNNLGLRPILHVIAVVVGVLGIGLGALFAAALAVDVDLVSLGLVAALVALGQALAVGSFDNSSISVSAVGSLAGAALIGPAAALPLALVVCAVEVVANRPPLHKLLFNCGALTLSSLAAAGVLAVMPRDDWAVAFDGGVAGAVYFAVNIGLLAAVIGLETRERWLRVLRQRFSWLFVYYVVYGIVGAVVALGYELSGPIGLFVFALPIVLLRKAQRDYMTHTEANVRRLKTAAATIEEQNESLLRANGLLRERTTEAMKSLAAAVDARDPYTAGHSRRVQRIAVEIGRELGLDDDALSAVSYAALFHDIGKLAVPDAVLLKEGTLDPDEWEYVRRHPVEGERIVGHLGFLQDATPAIRHHHERFDGAGYPDGLVGDAIPLAARVIHLADAFDSMRSSRTYREEIPVPGVIAEIRKGAGAQFCPRCVDAFERAYEAGRIDPALMLEQAV